MVLLAVDYALDKKGMDLLALDVREISSLTDYLLLISGRSDRQVQAIAENIRTEFKLHHNMLPLAIGVGAAGVEMRQPLGVVSIGGLLVSTLLTLFVIPAFYYLFEEKNRQKAK